MKKGIFNLANMAQVNVYSDRAEVTREIKIQFPPVAPSATDVAVPASSSDERIPPTILPTSASAPCIPTTSSVPTSGSSGNLAITSASNIIGSTGAIMIQGLPATADESSVCNLPLPMHPLKLSADSC